jgi:pentatricopeptide repeat protein
MSAAHRLSPTLEHYTCMVDMFGRAGNFGKVGELLDKASHFGHLPLFFTTLAACRKWRNVALARWAFKEIVESHESCASAYLCMLNIYAQLVD